MIDTLRMGFSSDVLNSVASDAQVHCSKLVDGVVGSLKGALPEEEKAKLVDSTVEKMIDGLF